MVSASQLEEALDKFTRHQSGGNIFCGVCNLCGSDRVRERDFKSEASKVLFRKTGLCELCQDHLGKEIINV